MGMRQEHAIFLSAGVPDPGKPHFMGEADIAAISAVVSALLFVALGRRPIVWGGHPAITPMVWAYAESLEVDYGQWVTLYQSAFFREDFPEENKRFENVIVTESIEGDLELSLRLMRRRMLSVNSFDAAIFAGGMRGIFEEYQMIAEFAPKAKILPIISTGGAAAKLGSDLHVAEDLSTELDYVSLLFDKLAVDPNEPRSKSRD